MRTMAEIKQDGYFINDSETIAEAIARTKRNLDAIMRLLF